jgi:hypothetical protein
MSLQKLTPFLLLVVAVLLAANLVRPLVAPQPVHAESHGGEMALTGTGANAWLVKGNTVYYLRWENQFESIRIYGPEEIEE